MDIVTSKRGEEEAETKRAIKLCILRYSIMDFAIL